MVQPLSEFVQLPDDFILISDVGAPLSVKPSFDLKSKREQKRFFDMEVHYTETLGDDRLLIGYYLFKQLKPAESILVIDAGTFLTLDLIDQQGFAGGYIFPGLSTFLSSYQRGVQLPVLQNQPHFELKDLPHSTEDAILGAAHIYLESILERIIKKTSPSRIVITGGSQDLIKNKIEKLNLPEVQFETYHHLIHSSLFWIYQNHLRSK